MFRRKTFWIVIAIIVLIPILALAWWLGSPLLRSTTVEEGFPMSAGAVVPEGVTQAEVEQVMDTMSKVDQEMSEDMSSEMETAERIKTGALRDADSFHKGSGQVTVYRQPDGSHLLRFENLDVTNGPDLHVILSAHPNPSSQGDIKAQSYVDLGKIKGNKGNQNYEVPTGVEVGGMQSVIIYCKPFHVIFSVAPLQETG